MTELSRPYIGRYAPQVMGGFNSVTRSPTQQFMQCVNGSDRSIEALQARAVRVLSRHENSNFFCLVGIEALIPS